ncbi:hypothetical protein PHSY_006499 [Pseudozyma hubeiensis SY62]|uniref:Uncharacterized protein n=1 Tax=Pseudozyma hubeiensis (strain SY62) TaxID=1305764 RepID=R9PC39_PSEHS|nr:hypothetical protein PHSY_006499 [Pseudozyma hubeiensis SY62]GAC98904.1 hypothetical protein PHSY_006499 [Pseudozyma hubeiensis SY62]
MGCDATGAKRAFRTTPDAGLSRKDNSAHPLRSRRWRQAFRRLRLVFCEVEFELCPSGDKLNGRQARCAWLPSGIGPFRNEKQRQTTARRVGLGCHKFFNPFQKPPLQVTEIHSTGSGKPNDR